MHDPPRNGQGDRAQHGGGGPAILNQPIRQVRRARRLRKQMSLPEVLLWRELRKRPGGFKFRKQFPLSPFVVDFVCLSARLAIEVDGETHDFGENPARDIKRDRTVAAQGFTVLRIPATDVLKDMESVVKVIVDRCVAPGPLHRPADGPPPRSGEDLV